MSDPVHPTLARTGLSTPGLHRVDADRTAADRYMALVSEVQEAAGGGDSGERGGADGSDDEAPSGLGAVGLMGGNAAAGDWYTEEEPLQGSVGEETGGGAVGVELRSLARDGKLVEVQQLLDAERERGAEAAAASDAAAVIDGVDEAGRTALIWAADRGHAKVVACLLRHGAAVDIQAVRQAACLWRLIDTGAGENL